MILALTTTFRALKAWRRGALALLLVLAASPAMAQVAAGYSEYFIPGDEDNMGRVLCVYGAWAYPCPNPVHTHVVISVTAWSDNTTVYFDHWENGYGFDPANPATADETYDVASGHALNTGDRLVFDSGTIALPRWNTYPSAPPNPPATQCGTYSATLYRAGGTSTVIRGGTNSTTCYDGGDRIYVAGGVVTVTRVGWLDENAARGGTVGVQGAAWEIYPIKPQLTTYVLPFGETRGWHGFEHVAVLVQATKNNTTVTFDLNHDGTADQLDTDRNGALDAYSVTLQEGQTFLLDDTSAHVAAGNLAEGAIITGSDTLQVKYIAGNTNDTYNTRGFSAFPRGFWTTDYYAPLDQPTSTANGYTDYYLYNPNAASIRIDWSTETTSGFFNIPATSAVSFRALAGNLPAGSGLYLRGSDVFWGVGSNDSEGQAHEWGYSLLPSTMLYREHFFGWAPDCYPTTCAAGDRSDMGAFLIAAQDNTTVFVDYDNDGTIDQTYTLSRLQSQYIYDPNDGDLSGARIWATGLFSMAYGQNSNNAPTGAPALDLGYVAIPGTDFISLVLGVTKSVTPQVVPTASGSQATFTLAVRSEKYTVGSVTVTDYLPPNWQYVSGTTTVTRPDLTTLSGAGADPATSGVPATGQTLVWSTAQTGGAMAPNQSIVVTFTARTTVALPEGTLSQNRVQAVGTRTVSGVTQTFTTKDFTYVVSEGTAGTTVQITKASSVPEATPVYPGDTLTYTTTVSNPAGSGTTLTGVTLYDMLPAGVSSVSGTTILSASSVADRFDTVAYGNNNGSRNWTGSWVETQDDAAPATGVVRVTGGELRLTSYLTPPSTVEDDFGTAAYNNNDGTTNWNGNWVDSQGDGPNAGDIRILNGQLRLGGNAQTIYRQVNLAGATAATITCNYTTSGNVDNGDYMWIDVASSPAGPWTTVLNFQNDHTGTVNFAIPAGLLSATTTIRIYTTSYENNEYFYVDNLAISYSAATPAISRGVDLAGSGATWAELAFDYRTSNNLEPTDDIAVQYRLGGGGAWMTLATYSDDVSGVATFAIPLAAPAGLTEVRFSIPAASDYAENGEYFYVDNLSITYDRAVSGSNPPDLLPSAYGYALAAGRTLTATFNVTVDAPLPTGISSITNTASTTSVQLPIQVSASATNIVTNPSVVSASVAGRIWLDADGDGVQDFGESGIANVEVTLKDVWGTPLGTLYTDVGGRYLFPTVAPGDGYYVEVTGGLPAGVSQSYPNPAVYGGNRSVPFNLARGDSYTSADLGYRPATGTVLFGDQVWVDANGNGLRDAGEVAYAGATVSLLLDANGNGVLDAGETTPIQTTTSGVDGHYLLTASGLTGGEDYFVAVQTPGGYALTTPGTYYFPNVVAGTAYVTADFGFTGSTVTTYAISDRVWFDLNGNGLWDSGSESGIAGVSVDLLDASLNVIGTAVSAADGTFSFSGVTGGGANYTTRVSDTGGVLADFAGTTTWAVARRRAESNLTADRDRRSSPSYGFRATRAIGDTVYFDTNGNGVQDSGEGGIPGVVVQLYQGGTPLYTTTTDANGHYVFAGLGDGSYVVSVPALTGYAFTGTDADPVLAGLQLNATITGGVSYWGADFGFQALVSRSLSGVVWNDTNGNGVLDTGETGIAGVTLDVLSGGTVIAGLTTDADGIYSVQGLAAGTYTVELTDVNGVLAGLSATYERTEGTTGPFDLQETVDLSSADVSGVDFGFRPPQVTFANVASFRTHLTGGAVVVEWRTSVEVGTRGFHIFRFDTVSREWKRLDERLVPGLLGHPEGGTYRFTDFGAEAEGPSSYMLVEVDARGVEQAHGPYTVAPSETAASVAADPEPSMRSLGSSVAGNRAKTVLSVLAGPSPWLSGQGAAAASLAQAAAMSSVASSAGGMSSVASSAAGGSLAMKDLLFGRQPAPMTQLAQQRAQEANAQQRAAAAARRSWRGGWVELTTRQSGLYYVAADEIAVPAGLTPDTARVLIRTRQLVVAHRGQPVPYLPDALDAGIFFYAEPATGIYTDENVYQIGVGSGATMSAVATDGRGGAAAFFQETVHREEDVFAAPSVVQDPDGDFWFWAYALAGYEGLDTASVTVPAVGVVAAGSASLTIRMAGGSDDAAEIDHHVTVSWNGSTVGEDSWGGLGPHLIQIPMLAGEVREGDNTLEVRAVHDAGVPEDVVYLDSVDLGYARQYRAVDDTLAFAAPRGAAVEISGFSSADVLLLDVTTPASPRLLSHTTTAVPGEGYRIRFGAVAASSGRYLALVRQRALAPLAVVASRQPTLRDRHNVAEYVLIAPDSLEPAAAALADYRNRNGLRTMVAPLTAIYSEFNGGIPEPTAIRAFLRYATASWQTPPRYVTLVGRGTWDYKDVMGVGDNLVPPLMASSANGLFVSDVRLADLRGDDGIPEVAIGRLPVVTSQELLDYLAKIERQESAPGEAWQHAVLMAADNPDGAGAFTADSDAVAALLPPGYAAAKVYLTTTTAASGRKAIRDALNAGVGVFNYVGHGGLDRFADEGLWTSSDVAGLANPDRLPILLGMTCVAGNFAIPGYASLAETMVLKKDGGAFAAWSPTGLSENALAVKLDKSFFTAALLRNEKVVGDAVGRALRELIGASAVPTRYMYNLLGEPVSRLPD